MREIPQVYLTGNTAGLTHVYGPGYTFVGGPNVTLGTNLPIQRAQLTVYDTLTATAASAQAFTAGTYLAVWGRNTD